MVNRRTGRSPIRGFEFGVERGDRTLTTNNSGKNRAFADGPTVRCLFAENSIDDGVAVLLLEPAEKVEIWKVGIMECWNLGFHQSIISFHYSNTPVLRRYSCLELSKTCA